MKKYKIRDDAGVSITVDAEDMSGARRQAEEWARGGEYDRKVLVSFCVIELDDDGDETNTLVFGAVEGGPDPEEPECFDGGGHEWDSSWARVGGCRENPGVFSRGGTTMEYHSVCRRCGTRKQETTYGCQRNPGQCDTVVYTTPTPL